MGCGGSKDSSIDAKVWQGQGVRTTHIKNNFKIVFLGKSGVGKTSITLRLCRDTYLEGSEATIGASFLTKFFTVGDRNIKFEIWDTAGQERYRALAPMYYRNADAAVLVYDVTELESFKALQLWYEELQKSVPDCVVIICGNKTDMESRRDVTKEQATQYANRHYVPIIEVSSKTGSNVIELFTKLGTMLTAKYS